MNADSSSLVFFLVHFDPERSKGSQVAEAQYMCICTIKGFSQNSKRIFTI